MYSIDSFVSMLVIFAAIAGLCLFTLVIIAKIRNTKNISFIFYLALGVFTIGVLYSYITKSTLYLVCTLLVCEALLLPYLVLILTVSPEKREERLRIKSKNKTEPVDKATASASKSAVEAAEHKFDAEIKANREFTAAASKLFNDQDSMNHYLDFFNKKLTDATHADGCALLLADDFDNFLAVKSLSGKFPPPYKLPDDLPHKPLRVETNFKFAQFPLSGNVFGDIATAGEPQLIVSSSKDPRIYQNGPEDFLECGSYIFVPMKSPEGVIGIAAISRAPGKDGFTTQEFADAQMTTNAASVGLQLLISFLDYSEHKELTKEGDTAAKFQKALIPAKLPDIGKLSIGSFSQPVENVCGDYYDVIVSRKDRISFVMIDAAGKGMNSLLIMVMVRAMLRLVVNTPQSAATILSWVNRCICSETATADHFASIALINYNSLTNDVEIATCGINPVLHFSAKTKKIVKISETNEPLGVAKETTYKDIPLKLEKGDILITCTDGLLESHNEFGVQYSLANLSKVIETNANLSGREISDRVKEDINKYCSNAQQYDDQSIMIVKLQG